ncbi:MAG TPA: rhomboid family intramembrane serine protease [Desulfurivibrionaceae bacterium]|nr:rhomboid family intramembrane serine protease [Desulfurivibrionaceae bacterium]
MFPLRDDIPSRCYPVVNLGLILFCIVGFAYELWLGSALDGFIQTHGFVPARFAEQWAAGGLAEGLASVFTSMFLHGGLLHLFSNLWTLWIFGDNVEDSMGHSRYLLFYLLCGAISVFAQAAAAPEATLPMVGASGAISGVLGAYFVLYPRARVLTLVPVLIFFYLVEVPAYLFLGLWILMQVLRGYVEVLPANGELRGGVAWWAHVGGFFSGMVLIWLFAENSFLRRRRE